MEEWALLLNMMTETRSYRPERPPIEQSATPEAVPQKPLPGRPQVAGRLRQGCGPLRYWKDYIRQNRGFYVPELDADCLRKNCSEGDGQEVGGRPSSRARRDAR